MIDAPAEPAKAKAGSKEAQGAAPAKVLNVKAKAGSKKAQQEADPADGLTAPSGTKRAIAEQQDAPRNKPSETGTSSCHTPHGYQMVQSLFIPNIHPMCL